MKRIRPHALSALAKVAVFMVFTISATVLLGLTITNSSLQSSADYQARFTDVTSLNEGDDVRIGGVRVGQVETISLLGNGQAEVEFSLDAARRVPIDTRATLKYRNLVGQRYIALSPGRNGTTRVLPPGGTIPVERTAPAINLTELFNGFKPLFRALSPKDVNQLSYEIIQVLQGEGGTVRSLLTHTASLTATLAEKDRVIGELIENLNAVLGRVSARNSELSSLLVTLQEFVSGLAEDRRPIGDALDSVAGLTETTAGFLDDARVPLRKDIAGLESVAGLLADNDELVERFLTRLPGKVATINPTGSYGSWFNFYLCRASGQVGVSSLNIEQPLLPVPTTEQPQRCTS
jgi:phospholipid/cholesterol/gamma-HCH transport system substrate-binding protein